ncbi:hypothetical protein PQC39_gp112 [Vibrio phage Vp_R1]|uniref:Uncharacterized protein n=1 Tax=Vibrio phage Vp_R1 TaxID=2059867 RepID=A0A2H5BQP2_9CAUD|nr:hypothetical protein PQC39_gp112 [Vibrio phage Vp_R1]AUG88476.1 hypothetical protein VPR_112 [Vibrio phage Vp_R1]
MLIKACRNKTGEYSTYPLDSGDSLQKYAVVEVGFSEEGFSKTGYGADTSFGSVENPVNPDLKKFVVTSKGTVEANTNNSDSLTTKDFIIDGYSYITLDYDTNTTSYKYDTIDDTVFETFHRNNCESNTMEVVENDPIVPETVTVVFEEGLDEYKEVIGANSDTGYGTVVGSISGVDVKSFFIEKGVITKFIYLEMESEIENKFLSLKFSDGMDDYVTSLRKVGTTKYIGESDMLHELIIEGNASPSLNFYPIPTTPGTAPVLLDNMTTLTPSEASVGDNVDIDITFSKPVSEPAGSTIGTEVVTWTTSGEFSTSWSGSVTAGVFIGGEANIVISGYSDSDGRAGPEVISAVVLTEVVVEPPVDPGA